MAKSSKLQETLALLNHVDLARLCNRGGGRPTEASSSNLFNLMTEGKFAEVKAVALGLYRQDETFWLWVSQATEQKRLFTL
jgi:hypothetical protein